MSVDRIFIGFGSNIGTAREHFDKACELLAEKCEIVQKSSIYITEPYGFADQPDFSNAVIELRSELEALELLTLMQEIEKKIGKIVVRENGPRCIDLDLLFYGEQEIQTADVSIPHVGISERDFVLLPMTEMAPDWQHPTSGKSMETLLKELKQVYHTGKTEQWS